MAQIIHAARDQPDVPLGVQINRHGGVEGLDVEMRLHNGANFSEFLDFNDGVFKAAGHTISALVLTELGSGFYGIPGGFDLSAITIPTTAGHLLAAYAIATSGVPGNDMDTIQFGREQAIWDVPTIDQTAVGSMGERVNDLYDKVCALPDASGVADQVWEELSVDHTATGTMGLLQRHALYPDGIVYVDTAGVAGTTHPIGTALHPVDNMADARTIADAYGIRHFRIRGSVTLDQDYIGFRFSADVHDPASSVALAGFDVASTTFSDLGISGVCTGAVVNFFRCEVTGITVESAVLYECLISGGTITAGAFGLLSLLNCTAFAGGVTIDASSGPLLVEGRGLRGLWTLAGVTAAVFLGVELGFEEGQITLAASNTGGTINLQGEAVLVDASAGAVVTNLLLNPVSIDAELTSVHGAGSWQGVDPTAVAAAVDAELTAQHGGGSWQSATATIDPTAVSAAVWDRLTIAHTAGGTFGRLVQDTYARVVELPDATAIAAEVDSVLTAAHGPGPWTSATATIDPTAVSAAVWDRLGIAHTAAGTMGAFQNLIDDVLLQLLGLPDASGIADQVWNEARVEHTAVGTFGERVNVDTDAIRQAIMTWIVNSNLEGFTLEATVDLLRRVATNRLELADGDSDNLVLYDDDGSTPLIVWDQKDKAASGIEIPLRGPARRGIPDYTGV